MNKCFVLIKQVMKNYLIMNNTLIEKFAEQSKKYAFNEMKKVTDKEETIKTHSDAYDNKFAELIINEVISFIENDYKRNWNILWRDDLTNQLKDHFNIKNKPSVKKTK